MFRLTHQEGLNLVFEAWLAGWSLRLVESGLEETQKES